MRSLSVFVVQSFFEGCHDFSLNDGQNNKISSFRDEVERERIYPLNWPVIVGAQGSGSK